MVFLTADLEEGAALAREAEAARGDLAAADFAGDLEEGVEEGRKVEGLRFIEDPGANSGTERVTLCLHPGSTDAAQ